MQHHLPRNGRRSTRWMHSRHLFSMVAGKRRATMPARCLARRTQFALGDYPSRTAPPGARHGVRPWNNRRRSLHSGLFAELVQDAGRNPIRIRTGPSCASRRASEGFFFRSRTFVVCMVSRCRLRVPAYCGPPRVGTAVRAPAWPRCCTLARFVPGERNMRMGINFGADPTRRHRRRLNAVRSRFRGGLPAAVSRSGARRNPASCRP